MGTPLRKPFAANDAYAPPLLRPLALSLPSPRVIPYVRLAPAPSPRRRNFSWAAALAAVFLAATLFLLGAVAGAVFWFTYDFPAPVMRRPSPLPPTAPHIVAAPAVQPAAALPEIPSSAPQPAMPPPESIVLPAEEPEPVTPSAPAAGAETATADNMQLTIRERGAPDTDAILGLAQAQLDLGKNEVALVLYERVLLEDTGNRAALDGKAEALGRIAALPDSAPASLAALGKLAAAQANDAAIQAAFGKTLARRGNMKEAIDAFDRAVRLAPDDLAARFDLAVLHDRAGDEREALGLYIQILQLAENEDGVMPPETLEALRRRAGYLQNRLQTVPKPAN